MNNIGFVGCGAIAKKHATMLQGQVGQYFQSRRLESAKDFCQQFGGKGTFVSYQEMLACDDIDAVVLCSPPEVHCDQILLALEAGKSVLVEKPMVITPEQLEEVMHAAEQYPSLFVMVAENYHYKPSLTVIQKTIEEGAIGDIQNIHIRKMFTQASLGWKGKYGALFEGGIHFVALCSSLMHRQHPIQIEADFPMHTQPERTSHLYLTYESGVKATIDYSWETKDIFKGVFQHSRIDGTKGKLIFESNGLYLRSSRGFQICDLKDQSGRRAMMNDFLQCLEGRKKPSYDHIQAALDLRVVFEAYRKTGREVYVQS
ncbi:MAG: Gfo/Idh/MocA family oxidoreductase [Deltaproteobacteria bacterium]|nr:Gfo/Idh/MocA family oxidoreductase [Deltaproteobacteria bacterium]